MSICKCKCDKIFDSDDELNGDAQGNSCCDDCYNSESEQFAKEIEKKLRLHIRINDDDMANFIINRISIEDIVEGLMQYGYRKAEA